MTAPQAIECNTNTESDCMLFQLWLLTVMDLLWTEKEIFSLKLPNSNNTYSRNSDQPFKQVSQGAFYSLICSLNDINTK